MFSLAAYSQVAFKGQLHVSDAAFSVQGSLLRVQMRVSYGKNLLNRGETLNFTPVLKNDLQQQSLSSVVITGKGRNKGRQRGNIPVVINDEKGGNFYFDYDTTIPFDEWMRSASLYVESEERSEKGKGFTYEDRIIDNLNITDGAMQLMACVASDSCQAAQQEPCQMAQQNLVASAASAPVVSQGVVNQHGISPAHAQIDWIQILDPNEHKTDEFNFSGKIALADSLHIGSMTTGSFNKTVLDRILGHIGGELEKEGTSIAVINITGYGAPTGDYRSNETRCTARAYELKRYLMSGKHIQPSQVNVSWVTEDWDCITTLIDNSELRFRNAALDIIQNVDVSSGREMQLKMLGNGSLYENLQEQVFPQVCRLAYDVTLRREHTAGVVPSSRSVTLGSLFATAQHFQKGSDDFNDLIDLSARLFPASDDACINAAGVALLKGDTAKAERYLKDREANARAFNNIGVLYLLKGDRAKAETYLRMASRMGVPEASAAMKAL